MQQADSLRETAHTPDDPAIAVAMLNATIGSTATGSVHEPKAKASQLPQAMMPGCTSLTGLLRTELHPEWIAPDRIRMSPNLTSPNLTSPDLMRAATLAATLATMRNESETLTEVAHDARNMVTALGLYCEFLEEPGVLATPPSCTTAVRNCGWWPRPASHPAGGEDPLPSSYKTNALTSTEMHAQKPAQRQLRSWQF